MKKFALFVLVAVGAAVGLRKARPAPKDTDAWSQATDSVPR
jgi:hypothetical protein